MPKIDASDGSLNALTRAVYENQHQRIAGDDTAFQRIYDIYENAEFGIPAGWWSGKKALDAGCGNFGAFMLYLIHRGPAMVHGVDLGTSWIEKLSASLAARNVDPERFTLTSGSVLDLPFPDASFDFVAVNGVLVHLDSMAEIEKGFAEGARVCAPGGYYFTSYGPCGGLMMDAIFPALQAYYRTNADFHRFIDTVTPAILHDAIDVVVAETKKRMGLDLGADFLKPLFHEDFCVFLQNYIQRPTDFSNECTPEVVEDLYQRNGFTTVVRMNHFVKRGDIRKYFAPLHYHADHPVSRVLYGAGFVQYIGQR